MRSVALALVFGLGCESRVYLGELPDAATPGCASDRECKVGQRCLSGICRPSSCAPRTCAELGLGCGEAEDGCGGKVSCGSCAKPATCGGWGVPGQCGVDECGGCYSPDPGECWPSLVATGSFVAYRYFSPGTCRFRMCDYQREEIECPEDCTAGICHDGSPCRLDSLCKAGLGCKWHSPTELRCKQVDVKLENESCNEAAPGFRCHSHLVCVKPEAAGLSVCAHLCADDGDCFGRGLHRLMTCVKDGSLGIYGWCD